MSHDAHAAPGARDHVPHVLPLRIYIGVWAALIVLTVITVGVSYFSFGDWNLIVAMLVATTKAALVCAYFMHLKYDDRFNTLVLLSAFAFLGLLFVFSLADLPRRGEIEAVERGTIEVLPKSSIPGYHEESHEGAAGDDHGAAAADSTGHGEAAADSAGEAAHSDSAGAAGGH
jgi:cytochrome c oxidase subunit 4